MQGYRSRTTSVRVTARRLAAMIGATVPALGGACSGAGAATFGTPLGTAPFNGAPNYPYDCTRYDTRIAGVFPIVSAAGIPASSCIWVDSPASDPAAAFSPPAYGTSTVTQVRVAVGPATGAMQAVVMRALYANTAIPGKPNYACCTLVDASPPFTPQADSVTAVNVDLPMREDPTPGPGDLTTIATWDVLGLAVLEPGVPMYDLGDRTTSNVLWNSATPSTQTPGFYSDTYGFHVAMNADYTTATGFAAGPVAHALTARTGEWRPVSWLRGTRTYFTGACSIAALCIGSGWGL